MPTGCYIKKIIPFSERFLKKLKLNGECVEWTGSRNQRGYGKIRLNDKFIRAHRAAWILSGRDIPEGFWVLHKCDNPPCCNIDHLFLGTAKDNAIDRDRKGRCRNQYSYAGR